MVFGTLYYQGFAKKDSKHGGKDNGKDKPKDAALDAEVGVADGADVPLLAKAEAPVEKP